MVTLPQKGKSVTYVSGTICYLCLGGLIPRLPKWASSDGRLNDISPAKEPPRPASLHCESPPGDLVESGNNAIQFWETLGNCVGDLWRNRRRIVAGLASCLTAIERCWRRPILAAARYPASADKPFVPLKINPGREY